MQASCWLPLLLSPLSLLPLADGSAGDRSYNFQKCFQKCLTSTCSRISDETYRAQQPVPMRWMYWTCPHECQYNCMWGTVEAFQKDGSGVPQFYGKWPFIRMLGIQEPASTLFSLLNGVAHLYMLMQLRKYVPSSAPMYYIWHIYALVAVNAWFWAVVFHTRDLDFTELMDYVCAVSLVFSSLFALVVRALGPRHYLRWVPVGSAILGFFIYHVHYLTRIKMDYGYNMKVNIAVGIASSVGWLAWCYNVKRDQPYVWKAASCILALNLLILLELGDFPPFGWILDAHSLWHLGTAPVPFLWYSFVIDDCLYMLKEAGLDKDGQKDERIDPYHVKVS